MILIGSKALNHFNLYPERPKDHIQDVDLVCSESTFREYLKTIENRLVHLDETKPNKYIIYIVGSTPIDVKIDPNLVTLVCENNLHDSNVAKPEVVLAMKLSHRYVKNSPHFLKTLNDIFLLRSKGFKVPDCLKEWVKEEQKQLLSYSHPNLNRKKSDFFVDDFYTYDHDSIHRSMALFHKPAYEYYKHPEKEVLCSKELFFSVAENIRLAGVVEEALVLALERHQIPNAFKPNPEISFRIALEKVCTSITSGWFREYAYDNYYDVWDIFRKHRKYYVEKFKTDLSAGYILPFNNAY